MKRLAALLLILTFALPCLAWAEETPAWAEDGVLRILGVGNSYTEDTFWELYKVGQAMGVGEMELATLVIGGCNLNRHNAMIKREASRYILHRNTNGRWTTKQDGALSEVKGTNWDFIIIQEHSLLASRPDAIGDVGRLADALKELFPKAAIVWNMTWSYPPENTEGDFVSLFQQDGAAMYRGIVKTVQEKVLPLEQIDLIIPNGTAIQNARETYLGDASSLLFRDSLHLADGSGRTIAAMNTLATLTGLDVSPMLEALQDKNFAVCAVEAVQHAQENPWQVTSSQYPGSSAAQKAPSQNVTWIDPADKAPVTDYAYSFVVIGDTQIVNAYYADHFPTIYNWVLDNIESKNIQFVFGLGDITDRNSTAEWLRARKGFHSLNGKVEYSLIRGNHDSAANLKKAFPWADYKDRFEGSYDDSLLSTYRTLTVGEVRYLLIALDYCADDDVLAWAGQLCESYPDHNVIITTHAYLTDDGTTLDFGDTWAPNPENVGNDGGGMWEKLISRHENIALVLSGHVPSDRIVVAQDTGVNGNIVTQMLIDPQDADMRYDGLGMVAIFYFSEDGRDVTVEYYSTIKEKFFMSDNQFTMTLDLAGD